MSLILTILIYFVKGNRSIVVGYNCISVFPYAWHLIARKCVRGLRSHKLNSHTLCVLMKSPWAEWPKYHLSWSLVTPCHNRLSHLQMCYVYWGVAMSGHVYIIIFFALSIGGGYILHTIWCLQLYIVAVIVLC